MQEPKGESLQPHVPAVTGQVAPAPHSLAELQAGSPQMVGLFGHFMMNLAEETCFRSIISASYLSWPGWKAMFLQWGLLEKQHFKVCPRNSIYTFYKYCHTACKKYTFTRQRQVAALLTALHTRSKNTEVLTDINSPHTHPLEKFPSYFPQQIKKKIYIEQTLSLSWTGNSPRNTANVLLSPFFLSLLCFLSTSIVTWFWLLHICFLVGFFVVVLEVFKKIFSFLMHHSSSLHTHTLLHTPSDVPCSDFLLYTGVIIPTQPLPSSELQVHVETDCYW